MFELIRREAMLQTLAAHTSDAGSAKEMVPMVSAVSSLPEPAVVWLDGEEDIATVSILAGRLDQAVSADGRDLIVDLSGLTFLSTATIDELIRVRNILLREERKLSLRSPSPFARRLLHLCGLQFTFAS
jgi:anti-anti-sigma factor